MDYLAADHQIVADIPGRPGLRGRRGKLLKTWEPGGFINFPRTVIATLRMDDGSELHLPKKAIAPIPRQACKPFLKWAGGKQKLLAQYEQHLPSRIETYYEPFLGGGALFFALAPRMERAVLSDANIHLINVYQVVRDRLPELIRHLSVHQRKHCKEYYYEVRDWRLDDPVEEAARFIYLNKTCFNGLYRLNQAGLFRVPIGDYKKPNICDHLALKAASDALQIADIRHGSYSQLRGPRPGDFVFFDPPYHPLKPGSFVGYTAKGFTEDDQRQVAKLFRNLVRRGVAVALTNSDCEFVRELYQEFRIESIQRSGTMNSKKNSRGKVGEVLVLWA